jgi:hypothetical protein
MERCVPGKFLFKIFALALIGSLAMVNSSLSEEIKCALRVGNFPLHLNEQFAGLFRVPLHPPDSTHHEALQRHLIFLKIWEGIILREMPGKAGGLCGAIATSYRFPDMRIFLTVNRTASQIDREKAYCRYLLEDFLQNSEPSNELIRSAAELNAFLERPSPVSGDRPEIGDAVRILSAALPLIYEKGSLFHTLTSVEWVSFAAVDGADFRAWIQSQRSPERPLLESIPRCLPPRDELDGFSIAPRERSESGILPAGQINLSRGLDGPILAGPLRYAVIVGNPGDPPGALVASEVKAKYCNREHTFSIGDDSSQHSTVTAQPRCLPTSVYDLDSWSIIYCDPADCTSEQVEKGVMSAIASDPEILDFARRSAATAVPRGPYLVTIK